MYSARQSYVSQLIHNNQNRAVFSVFSIDKLNYPSKSILHNHMRQIWILKKNVSYIEDTKSNLP